MLGRLHQSDTEAAQDDWPLAHSERNQDVGKQKNKSDIGDDVNDAKSIPEISLFV